MPYCDLTNLRTIPGPLPIAYAGKVPNSGWVEICSAPTADDLRRIVVAYCPEKGTFAYLGNYRVIWR